MQAITGIISFKLIQATLKITSFLNILSCTVISGAAYIIVENKRSFL